MSTKDIAISLLKRFWWLIAAGVFLLFIAFRSCKPLPSHKEEKKEMDKDAAIYKSQRDSLLKVAAERGVENEQLKRRNDTLLHQRDSLRGEVAAGIKKAQGIIKEGRDALKRGDTGMVFHSWTDLATTVEKGISTIGREDTISQQIIENQKQQLAIKDSTISAYRYLWSLADSNYAKQRSAYDALFSDYKRANSGLKFNKTLSRGLAIALLVAGAKIFIFK